MADETKQCPFCGQEIKAEAVKCRFCGKFLDENAKQNKALKIFKNHGVWLNKFLNLSFKIGKVFSSLLLFLMLFVIVGSGLVLLFANAKNVETPKFKAPVIEETVEADDSDYENVSERTILTKYEKLIKKIIKKHHLHEATEPVLNEITDGFKEEYKMQYLKGLDTYLGKAFRFYDRERNAKARDQLIANMVEELEYYPSREKIKRAQENYKTEGTYNKYYCFGLIDEYTYEFRANVSKSEASHVESNTTRLTALGVMLVGLLIFVILLFLPVLIKIEENTKITATKAEQ